MKYLKRFNESATESKLEDIEDMLVEITDIWPLIEQGQGHPWRFFVNNPEIKTVSGQLLYCFKLEPKFNKHNDLWPKSNQGTWGTGQSKDYHNAQELDEEIETIRKMISHTRLNKSGYTVQSLEWRVYEFGTWDSGFYKGRPYEVPYIELNIMEPSWWKGEPIPYKEVSDLEAGII